MSETAQENLLCQIAQGNKAAVSDFVDRYGGLLWSLAQRFTGSITDAEDAVQDIFVELWKKADRFDPTIASEKTFVSMVARRRMIDRARIKRISTSSPENLDQFVEQPASDTVELRDEAALALRLLNELPGEQCRTIKLAIYDGLSHSEISQATGMSLGTVKTHIRRGLIKLRTQIGVPTSLVLKGGVA